MDTNDLSAAELYKQYPPEFAADFLGSTELQLGKDRRNGDGPKYVRLGHRTVRYRLIDLIEYQETKLATSTAQERVAGVLPELPQVVEA